MQLLKPFAQDQKEVPRNVEDLSKIILLSRSSKMSQDAGISL
jgi:hypothetical protein